MVNDLPKYTQMSQQDTSSDQWSSKLFCEPHKVTVGNLMGKEKEEDIHTHNTYIHTCIRKLCYTESKVPCLGERLLYQQSQIFSLEELTQDFQLLTRHLLWMSSRTARGCPRSVEHNNIDFSEAFFCFWPKFHNSKATAFSKDSEPVT